MPKKNQSNYRDNVKVQSSLGSRIGDGKINADEFGLYIKALDGSEHDARKAFSNVDIDADGYITKEEFASRNQEYFTTNAPSFVANWFYGQY